MSKPSPAGAAMRQIFYAFILLFSGCVPVFAADSSACYSIQDADSRNYCIAKARGQSSACYSIQDSSLRSMCLAEVRK